jgi:shikimate kinase / 3-dehydroquinate synthase
MIPGPYRNVALIGFMGAGKSTAAHELAARLGWSVADSDAEVEREAGKPIPRIFADDGESAFRELEERAVARLSERVDTVIALGGGAITSPMTRERLRDGSFTVLLDVTAQTAWRRIEAEAGDRPLAVEARGFADLYEERRPLYHATADALVDAEQVEGGEPLLVPLSRPAALGELPRLVGARRAALIADRNVLRLVGPPVDPLVTVRLPAGEAAKTVAVARQAWTRLADLGLERGDVVVALGGGAATDAAGFVAATYQRGVPWIAAPTSLVGMVDAAIGGKTGLDLPGAKNYVGSFHPAEWVVTDPGLLETLPVREWACGFAEVIKTGLLSGGRLWEMVQSWEPGRGSSEQRLELIRRCAAYKAHVVAVDPREQGLRAVLNLGHTIGHAIEAAAGFSGIAHGEAVAVGLLPALWLSSRLAGLDSGVEQEVRDLLVRHELPTSFSGVDPAGVREALRRDKKAREGRVRFVLLEAVGRPAWGLDVEDDLIDAAIARALPA